MRRRGVSPVLWATVVFAAVFALAVAGCGGSGGSTSGSTEASGSSESEGESKSGAENASDTGESSGGFDLASWEKKTEEYEEGPTGMRHRRVLAAGQLEGARAGDVGA